MEQSGKGMYEPECPLAHDFVNQLSALIGHCDLMVEKISVDSPLVRHVLVIRDIARGMAKDLNQFQCDLVNLRVSSCKKTSIA